MTKPDPLRELRWMLKARNDGIGVSNGSPCDGEETE